MKHTPGPWEVVGRLIRSNGRGIVAKLPTITNGGAFSTPSNAHLIAAAPELLAALQELIAETENNPKLNHHALETTGFDMAFAAIAKVEDGGS